MPTTIKRAIAHAIRAELDELGKVRARITAARALVGKRDGDGGTPGQSDRRLHGKFQNDRSQEKPD